jgi:hypothetical protein
VLIHSEVLSDANTRILTIIFAYAILDIEKNSSFPLPGGDRMTQQTYTVQQIQSLLNPVFSEYRIRKAVLFGSYAKGLAQERSDIDLLVDSGLKGMAFFGLLEDVVTVLGKDVDLLDTTQVIPDSEVDREIAKTGVVIYGS